MTPKGPPVTIVTAHSLIEEEEFEAARDQFKALLALDETNMDALNGVGDSCFGLGDYEEAENSYRHVLTISPSDPDALFGLAATLRVTEAYDEAVTLYEAAFNVEPERTEAYWELAYSREMNGDQSGAAEAYKSCLEHHPDHGMAAHLFAAMTGAKTSRAPENYVRDLFDDYAETFDSDLVEDLNYVVPQLISTCLENYLADIDHSETSKFERVLDLGCGTGLVGEAIRHFSIHITGVDLSPNMLEIAEEAGRIDKSVTADMVKFLASSVKEGESYNLIVCGDALVYLGALEKFIGGAADQLVPGGLFCFTAEDLPSGDYALMPTGRYAHSADYVRSLLEKSGLLTETAQTIVPRKDSSEDIPGRLYLARKGAS